MANAESIILWSSLAVGVAVFLRLFASARKTEVLRAKDGPDGSPSSRAEDAPVVRGFEP
jgi:hypothetical protein